MWFNAFPEKGKPAMKICTVAGSPGTWETVGDVGYRTVTADPNGNLAPTRIGEEVLDTVTETWYKSTRNALTAWKPMT